MTRLAGDGLPLPPSTMSEATIKLGQLMHRLPAESIEIDAKLGIRVVARTEAGFLRWASTINAEQFDDSTSDRGIPRRTATGVVARIPALVIFYLGQIEAAS